MRARLAWIAQRAQRTLVAWGILREIDREAPATGYTGERRFYPVLLFLLLFSFFYFFSLFLFLFFFLLPHLFAMKALLQFYCTVRAPECMALLSTAHRMPQCNRPRTHQGTIYERASLFQFIHGYTCFVELFTHDQGCIDFIHQDVYKNS